jgi:hypothetical protein
VICMIDYQDGFITINKKFMREMKNNNKVIFTVDGSEFWLVKIGKVKKGCKYG